MEPVLLEKEGPIGWLTLNRPDTRNALSLEVMNDMLGKLNTIEQDQNIHVVVIRGKGPAFCAGHNLKDMVGTDLDIQHFYTMFSVCAKMMQTLHKLPQPVIAQVHGIATAAGCQLVAACTHFKLTCDTVLECSILIQHLCRKPFGKELLN